MFQEDNNAREAPPPGHPNAADLLIAAGVTPGRAVDLAVRHPHDRISDAVDAATTQNLDNPAGWIITALTDRWDIADLAAQARRERERHAQARRHHAQRQHADQTAAHQAHQQHTRSQGWANIAAATLDTDQLARLIWRLQDPRFPASTRSVPITAAKVIRWVAAACQQHPDLPPSDAVARAHTDPTNIRPAACLPAPPPTDAPPTNLPATIRKAIQEADGFHPQTSCPR